MVWIKVPVEHHPIFREALPKDPRVQTMQMFGGVAAKVNGNIFAGLFARSAMVNLNDADGKAALALDGAGYFDPMGDGKRLSTKIMLPEDTFHDPDDLRDWLRRAFAYTLAQPKKAAKDKPAGKPKPAAKPALAAKAKPTAKAKPAANAKAKPTAKAKPAAKAKAKPVAKKPSKPASRKPAKLRLSS